MKKLSKFNLSAALFSSILLLVFSFTGCDIQLKDRNLAAAPAVNQTESGIYLSIPKFASSINYINIYRRDVTGYKPELRKNLPYEKIGVVYPKNFSVNYTDCFYEDVAVSNTSTYQYCVRYSSESTKTISEWSADIYPKPTAGLDSTAELTYPPSEIIYDAEAKTIYLSENVLIQDNLTNYEPMIAFTDGNTSKIFKLPATILSDPATYSKSYLLGGKENSIPLLSVLSEDYLSTNDTSVTLRLLGILGQTNNYDSSTEINDAHILSTTWTPLSTVTLIDLETDETIETISVMNPKGIIGADWSDL